MLDRSFSEVDLRAMIQQATELRPSDRPGRWIVSTSHESRFWQVIVEPDFNDKLLVVITAFPAGKP